MVMQSVRVGWLLTKWTREVAFLLTIISGSFIIYIEMAWDILDLKYLFLAIIRDTGLCVMWHPHFCGN